MLPSLGYQGFRTTPIPSGWGQMGERWALWWNGREVASLTPDRAGGLRMTLNALKMWQTKSVRVVSLRQGKRFAERWCAARLYPDLPLREAVARLTDTTPIKPVLPLPGLPPTREQQLQAQRLDEAAAAASARVMAALAPIRPPAETKAKGVGSEEAEAACDRGLIPSRLTALLPKSSACSLLAQGLWWSVLINKFNASLIRNESKEGSVSTFAVFCVGVDVNGIYRYSLKFAQATHCLIAK